ncbi:Protein with carboxyl methyl esterase activity [Tulasnella sp. 424]|nr:Protein with carboxyl methyl esterase activity [Tulasnella sp. 424]KAG8970279.1 Protein with carboxyl methyl esterase activity [Tulasnella sp. 425]
MSDLARSALQARIAKLPNLPPIPPPSTKAPWATDGEEEEGEEEDEVDGLGDLPSSASAPASKTPAAAAPRRRPPPSQRTADRLAAYTPISASSHFAQALSVAVPASGLDHRVYYTPPVPGAATATPDSSTVIVCHHGAGYTGLSFACLAQEITSITKGELGILSLDARSHGKTKPIQDDAPPETGDQAGSTSSSADHIAPLPSTSDATGDTNPGTSPVDLSIERLTEDFVQLIKKVYPDPAEAPSLLLLGHSMGGTVLVRACPVLQAAKYRVSGVIVLDVVEGSALEAMPLMHGLLASRPAGFDSLEEAIEWHLSNRTIRNPTSARVSVPSMFVESTDYRSEHKYVWRAPLQLTAPYWTGWFTGLSASFLAVRAARLLILAGTDRLDKTLMIGQMQGKFQQEVLADVGHMLHEDGPEKIATILVEFWKRNERLPIGFKVKKVGDS